MLTLAEFTAANARHLRRWRVFMWLMIALLVSVGLTFRWFLDAREWLPAPFSSWVVDPLGLVGVAYAVLLLAVWPLHLLARRDQRLVCPHCDRVLFRSRRWVTGTGKCPHCAQQVITDPKPELPPPLTQAEADAIARRFRRASLDFVLGFVLLFVVALVGLGCEALANAGWVNEWVAQGITVVVGVAAIGWWVWSWALFTRVLWQVPQCPRCGQKNPPWSVLKSGRCGACDQTLLADAPADGVASGTPLE